MCQYLKVSLKDKLRAGDVGKRFLFASRPKMFRGTLEDLHRKSLLYQWPQFTAHERDGTKRNPLLGAPKDSLLIPPHLPKGQCGDAQYKMKEQVWMFQIFHVLR